MESKTRASLAAAVLRRVFGFFGLVSLLSVLPAPAEAQTFAEFFKQKKTQRKYLIQQIAALQVYIGYARQGYEIADVGIGTVKALAGGELDLHEAFFSSHKLVGSVIGKHPKVSMIIDLQSGISRSLKGLKSIDLLPEDHRLYIEQVSGRILNECARDLDDLSMLITSGMLEMKDEERLDRLERIAGNMSEKALFVQSFCTQAALLASQHRDEEESINNLKKAYETDH